MKQGISRKIEMEIIVPADAESYLNLDNAKQTTDAISKAIEAKLNAQDKKGDQDFDVAIDIEFNGFSDDRGNGITEETVKTNLDESFAEFTVSINGEQYGEYTEGRPSNNWYEPDDPSELDGYNEDETTEFFVDMIALAFTDFGVEADSGNIDTINDNSQDWESAIDEIKSESPEYDCYD